MIVCGKIFTYSSVISFFSSSLLPSMLFCCRMFHRGNGITAVLRNCTVVAESEKMGTRSLIWLPVRKLPSTSEIWRLQWRRQISGLVSYSVLRRWLFCSAYIVSSPWNSFFQFPCIEVIVAILHDSFVMKSKLFLWVACLVSVTQYSHFAGIFVIVNLFAGFFRVISFLYYFTGVLVPPLRVVHPMEAVNGRATLRHFFLLRLQF